MPLDSGQRPTNFSDESEHDMSGLALEIYRLIRPDFVTPPVRQINETDDSALPPPKKAEARESIIKFYKLLSFHIAKAVTDHIKNNLLVEVSNVVSRVNNRSVTVTTETAYAHCGGCGGGGYGGQVTIPQLSGTGQLVDGAVSQVGKVNGAVS